MCPEDESDSSAAAGPLGESVPLGTAAAALRHRLVALKAAGVEHVVTERGALAEAVEAAKRMAAPNPRGQPVAPGAPVSRRVPGMEVRQPLGGAVVDTSQSSRAPEPPPLRRPAPGTPVGARGRGPVIVESVAAKDLEALGGQRAMSLAGMAHDVSKCAQCRLCETRTQTVFSRGNPNSPLMFIGEAPGADEDDQGRPFVGRAGKLLDDILTKGMKYPPEDVYISNVLKCRPPDNRNPAPDEIEACRDYLRRQIEIVDPMVIIALGRFPAQWLLDSQEPIGKLRGKLWDVGGRKVLCTYHPAYLLRNPPAKVEVWKDVQIVMDYFGRGKPLPMRAG